MAGMRDPLTEAPPPSRFDPDDLDVFAPTSAAAFTPPLIVWAPSARGHLQPGKLRPQILLLALSKVGIHLIHNVPDKKPIGTILLPGISLAKNTVEPSPQDKTAVIYACSSNLSVLLVSVQYQVPDESANLWTKTVFQAIQPERVLVLEHTPIRHFRGKLSVDEPSLFLLETDQQKEEKDQPIAPYFPSGSLVDGLAAALLTYCQLRALRGSLLLTWPAEDSGMVQMLAAAVANVLRSTPKGSDVKVIEAGKSMISKRHVPINDLYL